MKHLRSRSRSTDATIWIGKDGPSEELLDHVRLQLKARELIKLKVQQAALRDVEVSQIAEQVAGSTGSVLVDVMGHTFTVYKKREAEVPRSSGKERAKD